MNVPSLPFLALPIAVSVLATSGSAFGSTAEELIAQGNALDEAQKTSEALAVYLEAEKKLPADADLLIKIATQYGESMVDASGEAAEKKAGENALSYALRAVEISPDLSDAYLAVAICYGRLLDFQSAREKVEYSRKVKTYTEKAIELDPSSDYAWHMLGRWHRAVATTNPLLKGFVKVVYGGLPSASLEDSAACLEKAASLRPERVSHHVELGITYAEMGRADEAKTAIERGLALPDKERDDPNTKLRGRAVLGELSS